MPTRKRYPEEFKREGLVLTRGERTVGEVADSLGIAESQLHAWKKKYGEEIGVRHVRASGRSKSGAARFASINRTQRLSLQIV